MVTSICNAQLMEYNLDDTVKLTSAVIDRTKEYTLSFKPGCYFIANKKYSVLSIIRIRQQE